MAATSVMFLLLPLHQLVAVVNATAYLPLQLAIVVVIAIIVVNVMVEMVKEC